MPKLGKFEELQARLTKAKEELKELEDEAFLGEISVKQKVAIGSKAEEVAALERELQEVERKRREEEEKRREEEEKAQKKREEEARRKLPGLFVTWLKSIRAEDDFMVKTWDQVDKFCLEAGHLRQKSEEAKKAYLGAFEAIPGLSRDDRRVKAMETREAENLGVLVPANRFDPGEEARRKFWTDPDDGLNAWLRGYLGHRRRHIEGLKGGTK